MVTAKERVRNHYQALGIGHDATTRTVEQAFQRWREERRRAAVAEEEYLRAESAYFALSDPEQRLSHDRQLGRTRHPAWAAERHASSRYCHREGMRTLARGRSSTALTWFRRAVELAPDDAVCRSSFALLLARTGGCLHEAARHAEFAVARYPEDPGFLFNLANVYRLAGLRARALRTRLRAWRCLFLRMLGRNAW